MTAPFTAPEELLASFANCLSHHTSRYDLLPGAPDDFIDYPAAVRVQCYDSPGRGWHSTLFPISDELYAAIPLGQGKLSELVETVTRQTLAYKLGVFEQVLRQA